MLGKVTIAEREDLFLPALPEKCAAAAGLPLGLVDKLFLSLERAEELLRAQTLNERRTSTNQ